MDKFLLREVFYCNIINELEDIGFDSSYKNIIADKFHYKNIRVYNLSVPQANILKQTALIYGADCAVNKNVITGNIDKSDAILCGSYSQLRKIAKKLKNQPFKLATLACNIEDFLASHFKKTKLVGILNVTTDSFSDGGNYLNPLDAKNKLISLIEDGADVIDIGAESTRPFFQKISDEIQIERIKPILEFAQKEGFKVELSVDTRSAAVAEFALNNGVKIINDISGCSHDEKMPEIIAKYDAKLIIQHSTEKTEDVVNYENVVNDVFLDLKYKIDKVKDFGVKNIIVDPGIGFGKSRSQNFAILDNISAFQTLGYPLMVGISRKSLLGIKNDNNDLKDIFTLAHSYPLIKAGVDFLRVHNVKIHRAFLETLPT